MIILLVEDEESHAEMVRRCLQDFRIPTQLIHVADGEQALDYLYKRNAFGAPALAHHPDVILLDWHLPQMSGLEVLKAIKSAPLLKRIPVIVLTAFLSKGDLSAAYDYYAHSFLVKPMHPGDFHQMLEAFSAFWLAWNQYSVEDE